jgi:gliding motility-associated-like protein
MRLLFFFYLTIILIYNISGQTYNPSSGYVSSFQKISSTSGSFSGLLDLQDGFGSEIENIGDFDGNGVNDIAVGAISDDDGAYNAGAVWILLLNNTGNVINQYKISATSGGFASALDADDHFGYSIANIGDLDNDGVIDLAVGANYDDDGGSNKGAVYILFMNSNGTVKSEQKISDNQGGLNAGLDIGDQFGEGIAGLGDLDGDGVIDIAINAINDDDGGADKGCIYILFLNIDGTVKSQQKISDTQGGFSGSLDSYDRWGWRPTNIGDHDQDGVKDIACAGKLDDDGGYDKGSMYILLMNNNGTVKSHQKISDTQGNFNAGLDNQDYFGYAIDTLGDISCDGARDLIVTAVNDDDSTINSGASYFINMKTTNLIQLGGIKSHTKISNQSGYLNAGLSAQDKFGSSVAFLGDINGDNIGDVAIGANGDDDGGSGKGALYILFMGAMNLEIALSSESTSCTGWNDGDASVSILKGCPPYSIQWSTGDTTASIDSLSGGWYYVSVSDSSGNQIIDSSYIDIGQISIESLDTHLCYGDSLDLTAIGSKSDTLVESLTMDMTALVNLYTNPTISGDLYYIKVKGTWSGAGGCEGRDPFYYYKLGCQNISPIYAVSWKLNNSPPPAPTPKAYNTDNEYIFYFVGTGGPENLYFSDTNYGDNSGLITVEVYHVYANYIWSTGDSSASINIKPTNDNNYYVTIDNGTSLCIDSIHIDVTKINSSYTSSDISCHGGNDGVISVTSSGGTSPISYQWSNSSNSQAIDSSLSFGPHEVIIIDSNNCRDTAKTYLGQPDAYDIYETLEMVSCFNDDDGEIYLSVNGNNSPYSFIWSNGSSDSINKNLIAGTYSITITDAKSCDTVLSFSIYQPAEISVSLSGDSNICIGDTANITGEGAKYYLWDFGSTDSSIFVSPLNNTNYILTASDDCDTLQLVWPLNVHSLPNSIITTDTSILYGNSIGLSASKGLNYNWSPVDRLSCDDCQFPIASPLEPSMLYLTLLDSNLCTSTDSVFIDIFYEENIYIANAFTPNNDGNNDLLYVHAYGVSSLNIKVYNRWGNIVFETSDKSIGWDGQFLGIDQEAAVYVYQITATMSNGEEKVFKGDVTLIR